MDSSVSFEADAALRSSMSSKELASVSFEADAALRRWMSWRQIVSEPLTVDAALRRSMSAKVEFTLAEGQDAEPETEELLVEKTCRG